jgi:hypothetical protein
MDIAERPLNGIGPGTIRGQPQQFKTWVPGQPLLDGFGFMNTIVVDDDIDRVTSDAGYSVSSSIKRSRNKPLFLRGPRQ